jgi:hypothetical protein
MFLLLCLLFYYKILDRCGGVVVWGEDHQGIRGSGDGMALNNSMDGLFFYFFFIFFYTVLLGNCGRLFWYKYFMN